MDPTARVKQFGVFKLGIKKRKGIVKKPPAGGGEPGQKITPRTWRNQTQREPTIYMSLEVDIFRKNKTFSGKIIFLGYV